MGLRKANGIHATLARLNEGGFSIGIEAPLAVPARETLFGGDAHGLTYYPALETVEA
ncbi:hypothetical protein [Comamonas kerstersii]|uniref:hypothetical protein n=1 Tax=Comamonas kerstersii TaxID=225992 RepID=UPI00266B65D4|nr:hypothetical protein [Comamonas kerstersii]